MHEMEIRLANFVLSELADQTFFLNRILKNKEQNYFS